MTPARTGCRGVRVGTPVLAAVLLTAACSTGDGGGAEPASTSAVTSVTTAPSTSPARTVTPSTVAPTTVALPALAERLASVEVSARIVTSGADRVVSIAATASALAAVPDPGDPLEAAAWCSGVGDIGGGSPEPFVVRITGDAVGATDGGIDGFELVSDEQVVIGSADGDAPPEPVAASLHLELDDGDLVARDAVLTLLGDPTTGTFRAETTDGDLVEGAFRCG